MSDLIRTIDSHIAPLVRQIDEYVSTLDVDKTLSFYDADWGGMPTQALFDKICQRVHGKRVRSHWITYAHSSRAIAFSKANASDTLLFFDYEPHPAEVKQMCWGKRNAIFGHHIGRDDIRTLAAKHKESVKYFNPRDFVKTSETKPYTRGVPVLYPIIKLAELHGVDTEFLGPLGLRAYGFKKVASEYADEKMAVIDERRHDRIVESVNLLVGHRVSNASSVVACLRQADGGYDAPIREIMEKCSKEGLAEEQSKVIGRAILESTIVGDVQMFPIKSDFELIKPFVGGLNERRSGRKNLKTSIFVQFMKGNARKVSIRTDHDINIPRLLDKAYDGQSYKNKGGHEQSAGMVTNENQLAEVLPLFLQAYFEEIGKKAWSADIVERTKNDGILKFS